jgi:error-prone DNA polymerase
MRLKPSRTISIDSKIFAMSSSPIRYAALLRRELSERNASYATLHQLPHVTSYGEMPVVVYQPSPCGTQHGNFISASYRALQRRPQWKRRFEKVHSQAGRAFPKSDCVSKELDSSMSSDALLMNIFCYPGVTKRRELSLMLGTESGELPEFGFKPRIPLTSGFVERTEIDMKLGTVLFEAKLTESDFQTQKAVIVEGYRDLKDVFDCRKLSRPGREYVSYQLLRNVLAGEMGKVLGFDPESLTRLSAAAGSWEWRGPDDTFDKYFRKAGFDLANSRIHCFLGLCKRVLDLPRHLGQHSGGMVVCQGALDSVVPLEPASMPGRVVVQWDKDDCADLGIVKVDLLGLGMMAAIRESIDLIKDHYQEEVDLAHIPADQPDVYDTIRKADTVGMFQIESRAQMSSLPRNNPQRFYDLVVQVALIRPGPIVGQMTNPYLKRRQGKERVTYPHESLVPVLERTLGVPLFQEQLLRMAMICANFTGGEAEELRRALGHKRSEQRMRQIETKLRVGMTQNGIPAEAQDKIVQFVSSFALYGFPESHSASFALLAYASAFLKVRYLAAFTCALLNCQPMGFYSPATLVKDAQRHGLKVKPVDISCSDWNCTLENKGEEIALRLGLRYVRGFRQTIAEAVVASRRERSFNSIADLTMRVPQLSKSDLRMLATVGALNPISGPAVSAHRRDALWQVQKYGSRVPPLFEGIVEQDHASPLKQMDTEERLIADYHGIGMTVGPHPMAYRRQELRQMGIVSASELRKLPHNRPAIAAGCVITRQRPGTAKGLIFLTLEDETGHANIIVMPDVYSADSMAVLHERFIRVEGRVQNQDGIVHLKAERVLPLSVSAAETQSHDFH